MKNLYIKYITYMFSCIVVLISCDDEVKLMDDAYYNTSILATDEINLKLPVGQLDYKIGGNFAVEGPGNGSKVEKVDVYITFKDVVTNRAPSQSTDAILTKTISGSEFINNIGNSFRPEFNYEISLGELLDVTGVDDAAVNGSDQFIITFVLTDLNGREFNSTFDCQLVCEIPTDISKLFLDISDSYGDGWDGAYLNVVIDGLVTKYTINSGSKKTFEFNVSSESSLELVYFPGNYENEHTYKLYAEDGTVILSDGPSPVPGSKVLDFCVFYQEPCDPIPPTPGDWTLTLKDIYADTWDGASLDIIIDGVSTNYTIDNGLLSQDFVINVPNGTSALEVSYNPGSYEEEHSFVLMSAFQEGAVVISAGPNPDPGIQTLNYCNF